MTTLPTVGDPDNTAGASHPTLTDIYDALGISDTDRVSICWKHNGSGMHSKIHTRRTAPRFAEKQTGDVYFGVNPVDLEIGANGKRGTEAQVTRVVALHADLDVKDGACPDLDTAYQIIDDISAILHERPVHVIFSGGGLQPLWAVEACDPVAGRKLLHRFGRLVKLVAKERNAAADSVFDIARVLRVPGTLNHKYDPPVEVSLIVDTGAPMTPQAVTEALDEVGILEMPDDGTVLGDVLSDTDKWAFARAWCGYSKVTTDAWATDRVTDRHPAMVCKFVRLAAMWRYGCIPDKAALRATQNAIAARHKHLCATAAPVRKLGRYELHDAWDWAVDRVSRFTDERVASELGNPPHQHGVNVREPGESDDSPCDTKDYKPGQGTYTDSGNAARLVEHCRDEFRYVPEIATWLGWDDMCWCKLSDAGSIEHAARILASTIRVPQPVTAGPNSSDSDKAAAAAYKAALAYKLKSLSKIGITAAVRVAQTDPDMRITLALLDTCAYELNTTSGIVDLTTGTLLPHNKDSWHTKITGTGYEKIKTPKWDAFLNTTFESNTEMIAFMQELAGYACIGEVTHHILPFLHGESGNNGKSVLLNVFQYCLGSYAVVLPVSALVVGRNSHTEDTADLPGARLAVCIEVGQDTRWDEEKIKRLTGGDHYSVRANYGHKITIDHPTHLIMIAANDQPRVETGGKSFFRRFHTIPFNHSIPDADINVHLARDMFEQEGPGILAWMVAGAVNVIRDGLHPPKEVIEATTEYAESEDEIAQWIDECCTAPAGFVQPVSKLYASYRQWCGNNSIEPRTPQGFGVALTRHEIPKGDREHGGVRTRVGLKLIDDPDADTFARGPGTY